jgi:hypothetical protein
VTGPAEFQNVAAHRAKAPQKQSHEFSQFQAQEMTMRTTVLLGAAAAIVATGYLAAAVPSIAAPKPKPAVDNKLKFPLDMPLPKKAKAEINSIDFGRATDEQRDALDQITEVLGQGYNSLSREPTGDCVDGVINGSSPSSFQTEYHLSLIKSADQLKEEVAAEASASASLMGWSAKATAKYSADHSSNANTEFLLVKVKAVASPNVTVHKPKANTRPKDDTPAAYAQFLKECGDQYIRAVDMGGEFVALFKYQSQNDEDRKAFEATFSAGGPSVSVDASYAQKMQAFKSRMQLAGDYERVGGEGVPADTTIDAVLKYSLEFQKTLSAKNMVLIGYQTEDYSKIRLDAGDYRDQRKKAHALREARVKRGNYLEFLAAVQKENLKYGVGDIHAAVRAQITDEYRKSQAFLDNCARDPATQCNIPENLQTFTDNGQVQAPTVTSLPIDGGRISGTTDQPNRSLKIIGRICYHWNELCFDNGSSTQPGVYQEVIINGAASQYTGPVKLPAAKPGSVTSYQVWVRDTRYDDNTGSLTVVVY